MDLPVLSGLALEAGLLVRCGGLCLGGIAGGRGEVLIAVLLLSYLLAESLQLLRLGTEATDARAGGFLGDEITHEGDFLTAKGVPEVVLLFFDL